MARAEHTSSASYCIRIEDLYVLTFNILLVEKIKLQRTTSICMRKTIFIEISVCTHIYKHTCAHEKNMFTILAIFLLKKRMGLREDEVVGCRCDRVLF